MTPKSEHQPILGIIFFKKKAMAMTASYPKWCLCKTKRVGPSPVGAIAFHKLSNKDYRISAFFIHGNVSVLKNKYVHLMVLHYAELFCLFLDTLIEWYREDVPTFTLMLQVLYSRLVLSCGRNGGSWLFLTIARRKWCVDSIPIGVYTPPACVDPLGISLTGSTHSGKPPHNQWWLNPLQWWFLLLALGLI